MGIGLKMVRFMSKHWTAKPEPRSEEGLGGFLAVAGVPFFLY